MKTHWCFAGFYHESLSTRNQATYVWVADYRLGVIPTESTHKRKVMEANYWCAIQLKILPYCVVKYSASTAEKEVKKSKKEGKKEE